MRRSLLIFLIALLPAVALAQQAKDPCPPSPPFIYRCHYEKIQPGMSYGDVLAIIGRAGLEDSASAHAKILRWVDGSGIISIVFVRGESGWAVSSKSGHELRRRPTDAELKAGERWQPRHDAEMKAIKECGDLAIAAIRGGRGTEAMDIRAGCMTERGFPPMKFDADGKPVK